MATAEAATAWTDIATVVLALAAVGVAVGAAIYSRRQAHAAIDQAADAQRSADAANDQAVSAREQADIANRQLALSEQVRREQQEPYVVVDIQLNRYIGNVFDLVIENVGPSVARNVKIVLIHRLSAYAISM